ncbi:shikimate kinase [Rhodobacteraceae bacterium KN286]|uniref:Shikimate kinase n=2 Tax=Oceanomicrobium pacificus TaxID=2692916 RepID=A0A6B0TX00_9RHOB|nr:shikimate kinase [Oceanomicrobium pacificus]
MGAGKTSVGRRLAQMLDVGFVDSDAEIVTAANMTIPEIFEQFGEGYFREGEQRVLGRLLTEGPRVVATGGGAFMSPDNRKAIAGAGLSVWLRADTDTLFERVRNKPGRPLLDVDDPKAVLDRLQAERGPVYALADVIVDSSPGIAHSDMAQAIIAGLRDHQARHPERRIFAV